MNKSKNAVSLLLLSGSLVCWQVGFAADSGSQSLGESVGATDYFKVNCSSNANGNTEYLKFKIIDSPLLASTDIPPQVINAHIIKDGAEVETLATTSGASDEATINSGDGKYTVYLDTVGTNTVLKTPQAYTFIYQCRNSDGIATKSSGFKIGSVKKIKNGKTAKYTLKCSPNKNILPPETNSLYIKLINQSSLPIAEWVSYLPILNAQVTKMLKTSNTSDWPGDATYSQEIKVADGNGDYFIAVNNTATSSSPYNAKDYSFEYSCMNKDNLETSSGVLTTLQDQ